MRRQLAVRVVAGCLVIVGSLSGCAEKHEASTTLPSASSTSADELPPLGPADFPVPDEARTQDAAGAEAALRYYLALVSHQAAKDGQPLRDLSSDCSFCTFLADRADQDVAVGNTRQGGAILVEEMSPPAVHGDSAEFAFTVGQERIVVLDASGALVTDRQSEAVTGYRGAAAATWSSGQRAWVISQLTFQQP